MAQASSDHRDTICLLLHSPLQLLQDPLEEHPHCVCNPLKLQHRVAGHTPYGSRLRPDAELGPLHSMSHRSKVDSHRSGAEGCSRAIAAMLSGLHPRSRGRLLRTDALQSWLRLPVLLLPVLLLLLLLLADDSCTWLTLCAGAVGSRSRLHIQPAVGAAADRPGIIRRLPAVWAVTR